METNMEETPQREYGKKELVELLTGVKSDAFLGYLDTAMSAKLTVTPEDMPKVHQAVLSYKANRIRNYGADGAYTLYFAPAFELVEAGFASGNFETFEAGCEKLLGLISAD